MSKQSKFYIDPDAFYSASSTDRLTMANETLAILKKERQWLTKREHELPALAVVDEFAELFPQSLPEWGKLYPFVFSEASAVRARCGDDRPGWSDYHMFRWLLNHNIYHVNAMLARLYHPAIDVSGSCLWMMRSEALRKPDLLAQIEIAMTVDPPDRRISDRISELRAWKIEFFGKEIMDRVRQAQALTKAAKN